MRLWKHLTAACCVQAGSSTSVLQRAASGSRSPTARAGSWRPGSPSERHDIKRAPSGRRLSSENIDTGAKKEGSSLRGAVKCQVSSDDLERDRESEEISRQQSLSAWEEAEEEERLSAAHHSHLVWGEDATAGASKGRIHQSTLGRADAFIKSGDRSEAREQGRIEGVRMLLDDHSEAQPDLPDSEPEPCQPGYSESIAIAKVLVPIASSRKTLLPVQQPQDGLLERFSERPNKKPMSQLDAFLSTPASPHIVDDATEACDGQSPPATDFAKKLTEAGGFRTRSNEGLSAAGRRFVTAATASLTRPISAEISPMTRDLRAKAEGGGVLGGTPPGRISSPGERLDSLASAAPPHTRGGGGASPPFLRISSSSPTSPTLRGEGESSPSDRADRADHPRRGRASTVSADESALASAKDALMSRLSLSPKARSTSQEQRHASPTLLRLWVPHASPTLLPL
ncbi:hypothetical protein T484DRAFT_3416172 [Baffinella frigidus]|nr:hypothetical protein T484DRAFT_3416172 [Cryptophyta sp. CCMP2293]